MKRSGAQEHEEELIARVAEFRHDPYGYVKFAWPWGETGSGLERFTGPQPWQCERLEVYGDMVRGVSLAERDIQLLFSDEPPLIGFGKGRDATASGKGIGKLQGYSNITLTPNGFRRWGDLRPGDLVFAEDGTPTLILQRHEHGVQKLLRVIFDDGSSTVCGAEHLWKVMGRAQRRNDGGRIHEGQWVTLTTQQLIEKGLRFGGKLKARHFEIPTQGAVAFPPKALPLDPYLLGVWLGDGTRSEPSYTKPDLEVIAELTRRGFTIHTAADGKQQRVQGIYAQFRACEFSNCYSYQKYVPAIYKTASITQRRDLLCGLLDTDGECNTAGSVIFNSTSELLAQDVIWLARSLGGKAQMHPSVKQGKYRDDNGLMVDCRDCFRVTLALPFNPFRILRKASRWHKPEARYFKRWIDRIEPAGEEEAMCISIAHPSRCYLTNDFIVTHNSALVSWLVWWGISTFPDTKGVLTAGTEPQLRTKTWPEVAKWGVMNINSHWFRQIGTSIYAADPDHEKTWRFDAIPWNANRMEAFAGLHNIGKRIVVIFDEASQIDDVIWDTTDGIFTDADTEVLWTVFGNPTRGQGRFYDCFNKLRHRWSHRQIDSRSVPISDKSKIQEWIDDYGEDSDYVRMNVLGKFPRVSSMQFISAETVAEARRRNVETNLRDALIIGVDVARFGDDKSVISFRKGRDARSIPWVERQGVDTMSLAGLVADLYDRYKADAIFVDGTGVGGGVHDRLVQLGYPSRDINFGANADRVLTESDATRYADKRTEMWGYMREWLKGGMLPDDSDLEGDLINILYGFRDGKQGSEMKLEKKEHMKARGVPSPDAADALALTFAYPVAPKRAAREAGGLYQQNRDDKGKAKTEYDPHAS